MEADRSLAELGHSERLRHRVAASGYHNRPSGSDRRRYHAVRNHGGGRVSEQSGVLRGGGAPVPPRLAEEESANRAARARGASHVRAPADSGHVRVVSRARIKIESVAVSKSMKSVVLLLVS